MTITIAVERICMSTRICRVNVCCWDSKTSMGSALWHRLSMAHGDIALWGHPFWEPLFFDQWYSNILIFFSACYHIHPGIRGLVIRTMMNPHQYFEKLNWALPTGSGPVGRSEISHKGHRLICRLSSDIPTCSLNIYSRLFVWLFSHLGAEEHILNPSFWWSQLMFVDYDAMWLRLSK